MPTTSDRTIDRISACKKQEDVSLRHVLERLSPEEVLAVAGKVMGVEPGEFRVRRRNSALRGVATRMLCKYAALTQREAAEVLHSGSGAAAGRQQKRLLERLRDDRGLRRSVNDIESRLTALSLRSKNR